MLPFVDDDMHFGGDNFTQPTMNVPDDLLNMGGDEGQFSFDNVKALGLPGCDIQAPVAPDVAQSPDDAAQGVENAMLSLMAQPGGHDTMLQMAGERPASATAARRTANLRMAYANAIRVNPALRWYPKLASLLPADKFGVREGRLHIAMPAPMFRKVVGPFLSEFPADWVDHSPIVSAVRGMAARLQAADIGAKKAALAAGLSRQSNREASDFDVAALGMGDAQVPDLPQTAEGVPLEPMRPPAGPRAADPTPPGPAVPQLPISLTDLSMKAVVDHIAGMEGDDDSLMAVLLDNGFPKARANEILAMLRYKRVSQARRASLFSPQGNRGAGEVEFTFR